MKKITIIASLLVAFTMNAQLFSDDFEAETADATTFVNWTSTDVDGDGEFFEVADVTGIAIEASPLAGLVADSDSWEVGTPFMPDNFLITTETIDLTGISDATLAFTIGTYQTNGDFTGDRLQVYISTSNDPAVVITETPLLDTTVGDQTPADDGGANSAVDIEPLDLSPFAGQQVHIVFRHFDTVDENSILIDNVVVDGTLSTGEVQIENFTHFFNQTTGELRVNATSILDNIEIFSVTGQNVVNKALNSSEGIVSLNALPNGIYLVRVTVGNATKTFKVAK